MPWKRTKQYRLPGYDYSSGGAYFITIVTQKRTNHFGEIVDKEMNLSAIGNYLNHYIEHLSIRTDFSIPEFEIMPNHLHLILQLKDKSGDQLPIQAAFGQLVPNSVSTIINRLKGKVKRWCNENGQLEFEWQPRFHDRIIRDDEEYIRIAEYIRNNIENWQVDSERLIDDSSGNSSQENL